MAKHAFEKFMNKAASGAKKKEAIRQEKRKAKQERREKFEERNRNQDTRSKYQEPKFKVEKKEHLTSNIQLPTSHKLSKCLLTNLLLMQVCAHVVRLQSS